MRVYASSLMLYSIFLLSLLFCQCAEAASYHYGARGYCYNNDGIRVSCEWTLTKIIAVSTVIGIVFLLLVIFCCCCCRVPSRAQRHRPLRYSRCRRVPLSRDLEQGGPLYNKSMTTEKWRISTFSDTSIQMPEPVHPPPYSRH